MWADRPFISSPVPEPAAYEARERLTFKQIWERSLDIAAWLRTSGIKQGDRVALGGMNTAGCVQSVVTLTVVGSLPGPPFSYWVPSQSCSTRRCKFLS